MVQKNRRRKAILSSVTHLLQQCFERIISDTMREHGEKASIGGRNITNLRLAEYIADLAKEKQEIEALVERQYLHKV